MVLDKQKARNIIEPFEKDVYDILLKLDQKVDFYNVDVYYHRMHTYQNTRVVTDFEIHFANDGKEYLIVFELKYHIDSSTNITREVADFAVKINKIRQENPSPDLVIKPLFLVWLVSGDGIPLPVANEAMIHGIPCYNRMLIDQLSKSIDSISPGVAFSEFLHSYFKIDIMFDPPRIRRRCMKIQNFVDATYTFSLPAEDLVRISHVNRANINSPALNEAYQRAVKNERLKEIAEFVTDQIRKRKLEVFPNNVVANIQDFEFIPDDKDPNSGFIDFPNRYGGLWIIDGQHRLYSFAKISDESFKKRYEFVVTAYHNISPAEQAHIFYTINDKQEGINTDLIMFIQAHLLDNTNGYAAAILLDMDKAGVFSKPLKKGFEQKERGSWLKLSTLVTALSEEGLIDFVNPGGGLLQKNKHDFETPRRILTDYVYYIKRHFKTSWEENKKGFAQSNQGLAILFIILRQIIENKVRNKDYDLDKIDEHVFSGFFDDIQSGTLNTKRLVDRDLGDIRSRTDRKKVAKVLWDKIK